MHHVAIMKKSWDMIPKILNGEKTIESRWYKTKRAPWGYIAKGDIVYFKNSGDPITAQATVTHVLEFNFILTPCFKKEVVEKYAKSIGLSKDELEKAAKVSNYCILIFLEKPKVIAKPFNIDKKGFGAPAAWITIENIKEIKMV